ncbi:Histone-lysine N-methyltransferase EHMT1, partial [Frankliniella fusca]
MRVFWLQGLFGEENVTYKNWRFALEGPKNIHTDNPVSGVCTLLPPHLAEPTPAGYGRGRNLKTLLLVIPSTWPPRPARPSIGDSESGSSRAEPRRAAP